MTRKKLPDGPAALAHRQLAFANENGVNMQRFWEKVDHSAGPLACWPWQDGKDRDGYGRFHVNRPGNTGERAHRVAFGLATGEDPISVLHRCDNPGCCNPAHLFAGDQALNNRDAHRKGRYSGRAWKKKAG